VVEPAEAIVADADERDVTDIEPVPRAGGASSGGKCQSYECRQQRAEKQLQKAVRRMCHSLASGEVVAVKLTIGTDGKVLMPRALAPHEHTTLGKCVVETVAKGRFPPPEKLSPKQLKLKP
jgi:hypothetical protein